MTGSFMVDIVTPIVALIAVGSWLGMVYWAAAHPEWKTHTAAQRPDLAAAGLLPGPAEPDEHEAEPAGRQRGAPVPSPLHRDAA